MYYMLYINKTKAKEKNAPYIILSPRNNSHTCCYQYYYTRTHISYTYSTTTWTQLISVDLISHHFSDASDGLPSLLTSGLLKNGLLRETSQLPWQCNLCTQIYSPEMKQCSQRGVLSLSASCGRE